MQYVRFTYHSLSAIEAQPKNCPFGVNTTIQLKNVTAKSDNNGIQRGHVLPTKCVGIVGCSYVFEWNRNTDSR